MFKYYILNDGGNNGFSTLSEVKQHILLVSDKDRENYNGMTVYRVKTNGKVDESFTRYIKVVNNKLVRLTKF
jgi:peroxiredoxin